MGIEEYVVARLKELEDENKMLQSKLVQIQEDYLNSLKEIDLLEQGYEKLELVKRETGDLAYYTTRGYPNANDLPPALNDIFERLAKKYDY